MGITTILSFVMRGSVIVGVRIVRLGIIVLGRGIIVRGLFLVRGEGGEVREGLGSWV